MAFPTPWTALYTRDDFGLPISNAKSSATLALMTNTILNVPDTAPYFMAVIRVESMANVYVALNDLAQIPAGASFSATTSELIPNGGVICRKVKASDALHFISTVADIDVSVSFYALDGANGI